MKSKSRFLFVAALIIGAAALLGQGINGAIGGGAWGTITGTLSAQTDIWNALLARVQSGYCNVGSIAGSNPVPTGQSFTFDALNCGSTPGHYNYFVATLAGNVTSSSFGNAPAAATSLPHYTFRIIQNGSTIYTFTPPASWTNPPAVAASVGKYVLFTGAWDGTALTAGPATSDQGFGQGGTMAAPTSCPAPPYAFFSWFDPVNLRIETEDATNCATVNTAGTTKGMGYLPVVNVKTAQNAAIANITLATQPSSGPGLWIAGLTIYTTTNGTAGTLTPSVGCFDDSPNTGTTTSGTAIAVTGSTGQSSMLIFCEVKASQIIRYSVSTGGGFSAGSLQYTARAWAQRVDLN